MDRVLKVSVELGSRLERRGEIVIERDRYTDGSADASLLGIDLGLGEEDLYSADY
jgi:hypothetical protein